MSNANAASMPAPTVLLDGLALVESPRWHEGRLWFAHWGTGEIVAVDLDGKSEVVGHGPPTVNAAAPGHGLGWSIDWLLDGRLLVTGKELLRGEPDGSMVRQRDVDAGAVLREARHFTFAQDGTASSPTQPARMRSMWFCHSASP